MITFILFYDILDCTIIKVLVAAGSTLLPFL